MTHDEAIHFAECLKHNYTIDFMEDFCDTIIEALKQEPCEDTVNRSDVMALIERINLKYTRGISKKAFGDLFSGTLSLPPITPKGVTVTDFADKCRECGKHANKWIPVSEGLPKDRDWYLGIFKEPDTGWVNPIPFICDYAGSKTKATTKEYWILRGFTDRDEHIDYYFNLECVAWCELPESYKTESEEVKNDNR